MSNIRSDFIIQLLEKMGTPLLASVSAAALREGPSDDEGRDAEKIAGLVNKTIQMSVDLSQSLDLKDNAEADAVRIAMAGVASPLVAHHFAMTGKAPEDADIKKMAAGLQAVMSFSDHFAPDGDNAKRLDSISLKPVAESQILDDVQVNLQFLFAFVPVANAVSAFPFGKLENKLIQEVAGQLIEKAQVFRKALFPALDDPEAAKRVELYILKAMADIYTSCHTEETARLMTAQDPATAPQPSIDSVWDRFHARVDMLQTLLLGILGTGSDVPAAPAVSEPSVSAPVPPSAAEEPPVIPVTEPEARPPAPPSDAGPKPEEAETKETDSAESSKSDDESFNPMSFFGSPPASSDDKSD